jgi:hypothetical protein
MGNYMVVNELKQHMLKEIHLKMNMIWAYENMAHFKPFKSP